MAVTTHNFETVSPTAQESTAALVALGAIDCGPWASLSYTIKVVTNDVDWVVYGANQSDYSDEQVVQAQATVAAAASGTYAVAQAPYRYYRVKIVDTAGGVHGTATVVGIAKA